MSSYADIILTVPWNCGESDCQADGGWHKSNYWINSDGYSCDTYANGDHEDVDESDIPTFEEAEAAWAEYAGFVIETGRDPLDEYIVKYTRKVRERWGIKVRRSIMGIALVGLRRGRRNVPFTPKASIPTHVAEYCNLRGDRKHPVLYDFQTAEDLAKVGIKLDRWHSFVIEREIDRPAARVAADLRRVARRNLKRRQVAK